MASHAGLKYVLETKNGYIDEKGNEVLDIEKAKEIDFMDFGFSPSPYEVFQALGFEKADLGEKDIRFHSVVPSYESRMDIIASLYEKMGMAFQEALEYAGLECVRYSLSEDENYLNYIRVLEEKVGRFFKRKPSTDSILVENERVHLYPIKDESYQKEEGCVDAFYLDKEKIYRYSIDLNIPQVEKYWPLEEEEIKRFNRWQQDGLIDYLLENMKEHHFDCFLDPDFKVFDARIEEGTLKIYFDGASHKVGPVVDFLNQKVREYCSKREMHITRMFGSYILLQRENDELRAVKATPVPIKYCPLMERLLKEVSGPYAEKLLDALKTEDLELQTEMMCQLINEVVIRGGYFDTNRPLNSCEANVLFGASETLFSAFESDLVDAAVIVSNNLGTIITTNASNTQGAVKRMTGLFYTSPSEELVKTAQSAGIYPVFPITAKIDQVAGVKEAIRKGYHRIAVSVAADDNRLLKELGELETDDIKIYKFGLCSTGVGEETAQIMRDYADVVWSCASKYVKEYIEPASILQVGIKIPVYVMTTEGWELIYNHLCAMGLEEKNLKLAQGENRPVILNEKGKMKVLKKGDIHQCLDCPHPCV